MGRSLSSCSGCRRHVRVTATECPFCGLSFGLGPAPGPALTLRGLGAFAIGIVAAAGGSACGAKSDSTMDTATASNSAGTVDDAVDAGGEDYGGAEFDEETDFADPPADDDTGNDGGPAPTTLGSDTGGETTATSTTAASTTDASTTAASTTAGSDTGASSSGTTGASTGASTGTSTTSD